MTKFRARLQWMVRSEIPQVLAIENCTNPVPWTEQQFLDQLRERNAIGMTAHDEDRVVGFMIYGLHAKRITLIKFAVDPFAQRLGVGTVMLDKLRGKLQPQRRPRLEIDVPESSLGMQLLLKANGVNCVNVMRDHFGAGEDAYKFVCRCPESEPEFLAAVESLTGGWA